jgi:DNA polymerase-4/protein ImuB
MPLQEAQARFKDAALVEADTAYYQSVFGRILVRLGDVSPVVDAADLGCAYVGLDGLEEMYGGLAKLINTLLQSVPHHLRPRLGVSQGRFPAYLAATCAERGGAYKTPAALRDFLAPFPVDVLPVPWNLKASLHNFGLNTLGEIASRPLGPMQAQFGTVGATVWYLAHGTDDTPLAPLRPEPEVGASLVFPMPAATLEPLLTAIEILLGQIFSKPEMRGRFARTAELEGHILNRPSWQRRFVFKSPVGDKSGAYRVIRGMLDNLSLPGPIEEVRLTLKHLTGEVGRQGSLFQDVRRMEQLRETVAQLVVSQGHNPIYQVREMEPWSRIPERRRALVAFEP